MDTQNNPVENMTEAASPPATLDIALPASNALSNDAGGRVGPVADDKGAARWGMIQLVLCAVGVGLLIGILALQVSEYLFYKAPPGVWPQQGSGGAVSAPQPPVTPSTPSPAPAVAKP